MALARHRPVDDHHRRRPGLRHPEGHSARHRLLGRNDPGGEVQYAGQRRPGAAGAGCGNSRRAGHPDLWRSGGEPEADSTAAACRGRRRRARHECTGGHRCADQGEHRHRSAQPGAGRARSSAPTCSGAAFTRRSHRFSASPSTSACASDLPLRSAPSPRRCTTCWSRSRSCSSSATTCRSTW